MVKAADVFVLSGILAKEGEWTYRSLADDLHVPHPVVQRALARAQAADLYTPEARRVHVPHFQEFAVHALRFVVPAELGSIVPGVPAAWAAEPVSRGIRSAGEELPPVWPYARGEIRGQALGPLHPAAPQAVGGWPELGQLLSILDSLRAGDVRVRTVARELLEGALSRPVVEQVR
jgi:hypothetical protein